MAPDPRYTETHAKAGLDFGFPAIETWQNQFPGYEILIDDPELTSVCPKTGLPDFGVLTIRYMPRERCLELKSLKEYLFSYRNLGIFQENIVNQVLEDVVKATDPVWAVVKRSLPPAWRHRDDGRSTLAETQRLRSKEIVVPHPRRVLVFAARGGRPCRTSATISGEEK